MFRYYFRNGQYFRRDTVDLVRNDEFDDVRFKNL
jgi:hypothetical protein